MNNQFWIGFAVCISLFCFMGLSKVSNTYDKKENIFKEFENLYSETQSKKFRVEMSTPTLDKINEREVFFINKNGLRICTRIGKDLYSSEMSIIAR